MLSKLKKVQAEGAAPESPSEEVCFNRAARESLSHHGPDPSWKTVQKRPSEFLENTVFTLTACLLTPGLLLKEIRLNVQN